MAPRKAISSVCVCCPRASQYRLCVAPSKAISSVCAAQAHSNIECVWPQAQQYQVCVARKHSNIECVWRQRKALSNVCVAQKHSNVECGNGPKHCNIKCAVPRGMALYSAGVARQYQVSVRPRNIAISSLCAAPSRAISSVCVCGPSA